MRPADVIVYNDIAAKLGSFHLLPMPGIVQPVRLDCLIRQMVDSTRRIKYVLTVAHKNLYPSVADPTSNAFDPIKAAAWYLQNGNIDEASWLVFIATHFGRNKKTKWQLTKNIYGALGQQPEWSWLTIQNNVQGFRNWLHLNSIQVKMNANFGNHHKFQSINALQPNGTGHAFETYIDWVQSAGGHSHLFNAALHKNGGDKRAAFMTLYMSMSQVASFGRTTKFDYLTMIGKLGIADIEPGSTFMDGATGPFSGARLLFGTNTANRATLNLWLESLENHLGLFFGMQVLEDALCNWQKSPDNYIYFAG